MQAEDWQSASDHVVGRATSGNGFAPNAATLEGQRGSAPSSAWDRFNAQRGTGPSDAAATNDTQRYGDGYTQQARVERYQQKAPPERYARRTHPVHDAQPAHATNYARRVHPPDPAHPAYAARPKSKPQ